MIFSPKRSYGGMNPPYEQVNTARTTSRINILLDLLWLVCV